LLFHYLEDFKRCYHSQSTVKTPAVRYRVQVRPKKQRWPGCLAAAEDSGVIACAINSSVQTYLLRMVEKPSAGLEVCIT